LVGGGLFERHAPSRRPPPNAESFDTLLKDLEKKYGGQKKLEAPPADAVVDMGASFAKNQRPLSRGASMSQPVWIDLASTKDVPPAEQIAARAPRGTHVVLRFAPALDAADKAGLIARLSETLPDHRVFESGRDSVTVMPVVPRRDVLACRAEVVRAIRDYRSTRASLADRYRGGTLSPEWEAAEHGGHCHFENRRTGQEVESPLHELIDPIDVDPYFFAKFVRTTRDHAAVAGLIKELFHDAVRILEVVEATAGDERRGSPV
jgi:hypothetical protein